MAATEAYGGFTFQNQGFQFYKHPPVEAYGLNRLLFEVRHSADLRSRILKDLDAVARDYELTPQQRRVAESLINVGKGGLVSEHVPPLVEAGAHPLQALMSLHVIFSMAHRAPNAAAAKLADLHPSCGCCSRRFGCFSGEVSEVGRGNRCPGRAIRAQERKG